MIVDIEGYERRYGISSTGEVVNLKRNTKLRSSTSYGKYAYVTLRIGKKKKIHKIHRLVAKAFVCNPDNLPCVNHIDANMLNNNASNLEWVTWKENNEHTRKLGRAVNLKGEKHANAVLSDRDVDKIRELAKRIPQKEIAVRYGVSKATISRIVTFKRRRNKTND